jgi:hypothetical protein
VLRLYRMLSHSVSWVCRWWLPSPKPHMILSFQKRPKVWKSSANVPCQAPTDKRVSDRYDQQEWVRSSEGTCLASLPYTPYSYTVSPDAQQHPPRHTLTGPSQEYMLVYHDPLNRRLRC